MKLTVLGCSGTIPGPDSPASGYLVEADGFRLVLDLGHGAFGALQRFVRPEEVDALFVSHLHPDHFIDLTALATYLQWGPGRPYSRLPVIGPAAIQNRLSAAYAGAGHLMNLEDLFTFAAPEPGAVGPFNLSFAQMSHPIETYAVRVEAHSRSLVYSGDTGPSSKLVELARDADVLLCEAAFGPAEEFLPDLHLTARHAGEHATAAGVGRLILTHVPPWGSRSRSVTLAGAAFAGPILAASPDACYEI